MSKIFREKFPDGNYSKEDMRKHCQRPGKFDKKGKIIYFTEQSHKDSCNINSIIKKFDKNGLITHVSKIEAKYGDLTGLDFQSANNLVIKAMNDFMELPSKIRNRFKNSPEMFIEFMDNPDNRDEAIALGLIRGDWTPETDGLGEHIKSEEEREKIVPKVE